MKLKWIGLVLSLLFLSSCCSLENEISHCGETCTKGHCSYYSRCPYYPLSCGFRRCGPPPDCAPKVQPQPQFSKTGVADYDTYRMKPRCKTR